jgi:hypothetical protein
VTAISVHARRKSSIVVEAPRTAISAAIPRAAPTRPPARRRLPTGEISLSGESGRVAELIETFAAAGAH